MGYAGVATLCNKEAGGSALPRTLLGILQQEFSWGGSGIPSQHRKATCAFIQALVFLANLGRKTWIRHEANLVAG